MPEFEQWVDTLRPLGYRPVFVSGHNETNRFRFPDGLQEVRGDVRIAAIASKDGRSRVFKVSQLPEGEWSDYHKQMAARGYQLSSQTTFTDGNPPAAQVLTIYTEAEFGTGMYMIPSQWFPDPYPEKWQAENYRPFSVAGRPAGDFWRLTLGTRASRGVAWEFYYEQTLDQFAQLLDKAKRRSFHPESLFVCPGKARGGFGVVLTHDKPELLWETSLNIASSELEPEALRTSAKGFIPDQLVGYDTGGESRFLAAWTRDPSRYARTGLCDASIEPVDEAIEQFLIVGRIPSASVAFFRKGILIASSGYGYRDRSFREPCHPLEKLPIGKLSVPVMAGAVHSLIAKKRLREDAALNEILQASTAGEGDGDRPAGAASMPHALTVGMILDGLRDSHKEFSLAERNALAAIAGIGSSSATGPESISDFEFRGLLLEKLLAAATGKPAAVVIAAEVFSPVKKSAGAAVKTDRRAQAAPGGFTASAAEVGAFLLKHGFDGRPIKPGAQAKRETFVGQRDTALSLVIRRDDLLVVVIAKLMDDPLPGVGEVLRDSLIHALDSLAPMDPPRKSRVPATR